MLVELIQNFISGSESTLNSLFNSMLNLIFYIERELMYIPTGAMERVSKVDFNAIYKIVFNYAFYLLIIIFIVKAIKTYFLMREGDSEQNPIQLAIGMLKAIIVMICFKEIYTIGVGIVESFLNSILNVMTIDKLNLAESLSNNIQGGIFYSSSLFSSSNMLAIINLSVHNERNRTFSYENCNTICKHRIIKFR